MGFVGLRGGFCLWEDGVGSVLAEVFGLGVDLEDRLCGFLGDGLDLGSTCLGACVGDGAVWGHACGGQKEVGGGRD